MGVAGVLIGYQLVQFSAEGFDATAGLALLAVAYVGGIASVRGAIIAGLLAPAGVVFYVLSELTGGRPADYQFLLTGVALIIATSHLPEGLTGLFERRERPARLVSRPAPSRARPPAPPRRVVALHRVAGHGRRAGHRGRAPLAKGRRGPRRAQVTAVVASRDCPRWRP